MPVNTDFARLWSNWECRFHGSFLLERKPLRNRSSGIELYEGLSYTHAEGQSVGTSSWHELVKQRLLDWSRWEMDEIDSGSSTRSTSWSTTWFACGSTSWTTGQCLHRNVWRSTRRGGSQSGWCSRTTSGELGAHWSGWSGAMGSKEKVPHEEAINSRLRGCHFEDANAVQQSGGVLSGGRLGQCMGYFGTSSPKEAGNRGKTADHRRSTVHGSHSTTWWAVQEPREELWGPEGIKRSCGRRGVGQPTSSIGRSKEEPTTMERGSEEGVWLLDRLWGDQTNRVEGICGASGAVWGGGVNPDDVGCGEEATNETQSQSGSMRQPCPRGNRVHHCRRCGYGGGTDFGVTCCPQGPHHPHLRYQNSFPPGSEKIDTRTDYDPDTTSNPERSPTLATSRREVGGGKGNVRTDWKSEGLGRLQEHANVCNEVVVTRFPKMAQEVSRTTLVGGLPTRCCQGGVAAIGDLSRCSLCGRLNGDRKTWGCSRCDGPVGQDVPNDHSWRSVRSTGSHVLWLSNPESQDWIRPSSAEVCAGGLAEAWSSVRSCRSMEFSARNQCHAWRFLTVPKNKTQPERISNKHRLWQENWDGWLHGHDRISPSRYPSWQGWSTSVPNGS